MPQLVKLQDQLKDSGFIIVAPESQNSTEEDIEKMARQFKMNFIVTSGGSIPGEKIEGLPAQFLFDSSGKLVEKGHHIALAKVQELVASEPHFLAAGRTYTKHKAEADALKRSKAYGQIVKKLEKSLTAGGEPAAEAKFLTERIREFGQKQVEQAKQAEADDPLRASQAYTEIAANWKGDELGTQASARLKELKSDAVFQTELKASTMLHQILAECDKLVAQGGTINLGYGPNQKTATTIRAGATALRKKYPDSKAVARLPVILKGFGFKDV